MVALALVIIGLQEVVGTPKIPYFSQNLASPLAFCVVVKAKPECCSEQNRNRD